MYRLLVRTTFFKLSHIWGQGPTKIHGFPTKILEFFFEFAKQLGKRSVFEAGARFAPPWQFLWTGRNSNGLDATWPRAFHRYTWFILLMEEILHQLIYSLSHDLQGFIHPRWCKISSINSINMWADSVKCETMRFEHSRKRWSFWRVRILISKYLENRSTLQGQLCTYIYIHHYIDI